MKHFFGIPSVLALSAASISVSFLSCKAGDASGNSSEKPIFADAPGSPFAVAGDTGNVVIGDMNRDGKPDLVVTGGRSRGILVLPGRGDGRFGARDAALTAPESPGELVLASIQR